MNKVHSSWSLSTWGRQESDPPEKLSPSLVAELRAKVDGVPDDTHVTITAGMLRALLAPHERQPLTPGVEITDPARRVTYRATIGRGEGQVWLRTVEVIPHDSDTRRPDPARFRIPVQAVADQAAYLLAQHDSREHVLIGWPAAKAEGQPEPEELCALLRRGETRRTLAAHYGLSVSRVDDWLRLARRERPDLDWPPRRRGPAPQPTTDKRAARRPR